MHLLYLSLFLLLSSSLLYPSQSYDTECSVVISRPNFDRRVNKEKLRLIQYNVEWLFTDYYSASDCPGQGCTWKNQSEAFNHMDVIAKNLQDMDGDIIHFCEVEGCDELNQLIEKVGDLYQPYLLKGTDTSTGQNVAILTKIDPLSDLMRTSNKYSYPLGNSSCSYTGNPSTSGVSKHFYTFFDWNNIPIAFIGAHLLAFPTDPSRCAAREAQAQVLQKMIAEFSADGFEIVMMGDFNDYDRENMDRNEDIPTSKVLDILKGLEGDDAGKYYLHSISEKIVQEERYTEWWDKNGDCRSEWNEFSMIDHILVSPYLFEKIATAYIYHEYEEFCGKYNSDHYPVIVEFSI